MDNDKKVVNTEEQNRAVNPGDSVTQEDSISQEPAHDPSIDSSRAATDTEPEKQNTMNDLEEKKPANPNNKAEGDDMSALERNMP